MQPGGTNKMELQTKHGVLAHILTTTDEDTLIMGVTAKEKSIMPDHCELTTHLSTMAFELIGADQFSVNANLSAEKPETLRNFGVLESILLMAYQEGQKSKRQECADICAGLAGIKWVNQEAASECADAILASGVTTAEH